MSAITTDHGQTNRIEANACGCSGAGQHAVSAPGETPQTNPGRVVDDVAQLSTPPAGSGCRRTRSRSRSGRRCRRRTYWPGWTRSLDWIEERTEYDMPDDWMARAAEHVSESAAEHVAESAAETCTAVTPGAGTAALDNPRQPARYELTALRAALVFGAVRPESPAPLPVVPLDRRHPRTGRAPDLRHRRTVPERLESGVRDPHRPLVRVVVEPAAGHGGRTRCRRTDLGTKPAKVQQTAGRVDAL